MNPFNLEQDVEPAMLFCTIDYANVDDIEEEEDEDEIEEEEQDNNDFYRNNDYWGDRPLTPEEDRLNGLHINFPRRNYNEDDNLLQYILDDDDVITYDCPMEADAFYAD